MTKDRYIVRRRMIKPCEEPPTNGLYEGKVVRFYGREKLSSYMQLAKVLRSNSAIVDAAVPDRRIFLLIGPRGAGKGDLLMCLESQEVIPSLRTPSTPAAFLSFSFSPEISSIFDHICVFLERSLHLIAPDVARDSADKLEELSKRRVEKLECLLGIYSDARLNKLGRRPLVVINHTGLMFDGQGRPKNAQFDLLFCAIAGPRSRNSSIDWVLLGDEDHTPECYRDSAGRGGALPKDWPQVEPQAFTLRELRPDNLSAQDAQELDSRISRLGLNVVADAGADAFVHFVRQDEAQDIAKAYFDPRVAEAVEQIRRDQQTDVWNAVGRKRINLTMFLACAEYYQLSKDMFTAEQYLSQEAAYLRSSDEQSRDAILIRRLLGHYLRMHDHRCDPAVRFLDKQQDQPIRDVLFGPFGWDLQLRIMWQLAVIGFPIEADIVSRCPEIDERLRFKWPADEDMQRHFLERALDILVHRCLVIRFIPAWKVPNAKGKVPDARQPERFGVHRFVQQFFFRRLYAPQVDLADVDQLSLTLYAHQPNDLPSPGIEAHHRIRRLANGLAGFPAGGRAPPPTPPNEAQRALMLRAASGVVRTVYSLGIVSRLDVFGRVSPPSYGYFEEHRRLVRWLLFMAGKLEVIGKAGQPFFAEEIVWLFNECGVMSLVEGRLNDAAALLGAAGRVARRDIEEPNVSGPLWRATRLNRCIVDIERGAGRRAKPILESIWASKDEQPEPELVAHGYLGLLDHLAGNFPKAEKRYELCVERLSELNATRAASIFCRHWADLARMRAGEEGKEGALELVDRAIHLAANGAHEDVRYQARLSRVRIRFEFGLGSQDRPLQQELDRIMRYARTMGLPRLICEANYVDAFIRLRRGDARQAAVSATTSLEIAIQNDLNLRKISALILLARVYDQRGQSAAAAPLRAWARELSRSAQFYSVQELRRPRVQRDDRPRTGPVALTRPCQVGGDGLRRLRDEIVTAGLSPSGDAAGYPRRAWARGDVWAGSRTPRAPGGSTPRARAAGPR